MKEQVLFIIWDEQDGYMTHKLYLDRTSARIALHEHYTDFWIKTEKAKIETIKAVSYR